MKMTYKCLVIYLILFVGVAALASGDGGLPTTLLRNQTLNFTLTILMLAYFTRTPIKKHFTGKVEEFFSHQKKAEEDKQKAEAAYKSIQEKIQSLDSQREATLKTAATDAGELKDKILAEANVNSTKLEKEAGNTALFEIERAKVLLREELISASFKSATSDITTKIDVAEHKKLGSEFIDKIQAVNP